MLLTCCLTLAKSQFQAYSPVKEVERELTVNKVHLRSLPALIFHKQFLSFLSSLTWLTLSPVFVFKTILSILSPNAISSRSPSLIHCPQVESVFSEL